MTLGGVVNFDFDSFVNWDLLSIDYIHLESSSNYFTDIGVGSSGNLWQGWALGDFSVDTAATYLVQCVDTDFTQTFTQSMISLAGKW